MSDEVTGIINTLSEKLGVAVDYIIPAVSRYKIITGIFIIIASILSFIVLYFIFKKIDDDNIAIPLVIIFIVFLVGLYKVLVWSIAPEGALINYILEAI